MAQLTIEIKTPTEVDILTDVSDKDLVEDQIKQELCVITNNNDYFDNSLSKSSTLKTNDLCIKIESVKEFDEVNDCRLESWRKVEEDVSFDYQTINERNHKPPFICHHCQKQFSLKKKIIRHLTNFHVNNFSSDFILEQKESFQNPVECHDCKKTFIRKSTLIRHRMIHTGCKPYGCHNCSKRFYRSDVLRRHEKREHNLSGHYRCKFCSMSFYLEVNLLKHQEMHANRTSKVCQVCCTQFTTKFSFNRHMENVHLIAKQKSKFTRCFECDECPKSFTSRADLKRHRFVHSGEKPFKCNVCLKSFSQRVSLTRHLRIHTGEKLFRCGKCSLPFSRSDTLRAHFIKNECRIHVDEKSILQ